MDLKGKSALEQPAHVNMPRIMLLPRDPVI